MPDRAVTSDAGAQGWGAVITEGVKLVGGLIDKNRQRKDARRAARRNRIRETNLARAEIAALDAKEEPARAALMKANQTIFNSEDRLARATTPLTAAQPSSADPLFGNPTLLIGTALIVLALLVRR